MTLDGRKWVVGFASAAAILLAPQAWAGPCDVNQVRATTQARKSQDVFQSTGLGAALGGFAGGLIGNNTGDGNAKKGAVIGTVLGGAAGYMTGQEAAKRRESFETESAYLECQIETANITLQAQNAQISSAKSQLSIAQQEVADLNARAAAGSATKRELLAKRKQLGDHIKRYDVQLAEMSTEMNRYAQMGAGTGASGSDDPNVLARRRQELAGTRAQLQISYNELNQIRDETQIALNSVATKTSG